MDYTYEDIAKIIDHSLLTPSLTDQDLDRTITFKMLNGNPAEAPLTHVVLHVVNHATLHRGQVVAMIRQLGVKPPATDLIGYYRELKAASA